jgi:two-component system, OmpR family, sensor kinase
MTQLYGRIRRRVLLLPLRVRLALAATLLLPVALGVVFGLVFLRFEGSLNSAIDGDLRARAEALATMVAARGPAAIDSLAGRDLLRPQGAFAQVVDARGRVVATSDVVAHVPLLTPAQAATALTRGFAGDHGRIRSVAKRSRIVAVPVDHSARAVVVGRSLKGREGANESFGRALLIGGPLALLLSAAACYLVAAAALRPVESMRRRAAEISGDQPSARLPVPPADDEIGRLGATLNDMLARLEDALARQQQLTQNASHELRTPLTVLTAEIELTLQTDLPDDARVAMTSALAEARRVSRLADDLLTLSQLEESGLPLSREPVDLDEVLRTVAARAGDRARAEGRSIAVSAQPTIVSADPLRLEQALGNLVDNALSHGQGTVTLALRHDGAELVITVSDEGHGVPSGLRTLAFERFSRASTIRGGAGLGLAIVRAIAHAHGGHADIAHDDPSAIVVTLPVDPADRGGMPVPPTGQ